MTAPAAVRLTDEQAQQLLDAGAAPAYTAELGWHVIDLNEARSIAASAL